MIGLQDDVSATASIASAGSTLGHVFLALKGDATFAAVTRPRVDFYFINEHGLLGNERMELSADFAWSAGSIARTL